MLDMNPVEDGDEFFNPYTTDGGKPAESDATTTTQEETNQPATEDIDEDTNEESVEASLMRERIAYLTSVEAARINEMVDRKDFLDQIDGFYSKWSMTLLNNGIPALTVRDIVKDHKDGLLERAGRAATMGDLKPLVGELTKSWQD